MSEHKKPSVDIAWRGEQIAVVMNMDSRHCDVGIFADSQRAGNIAVFLVEALGEAYLAGLHDGHAAAERAIDRVAAAHGVST
jgi:hypothetical protein